MRPFPVTWVLKSCPNYRASAVQFSTARWSDRQLSWAQRSVRNRLYRGGGGVLRLGGCGVLIQKPTLFEVKPEKDKTFGIVSSVSVSYAPWCKERRRRRVSKAPICCTRWELRVLYNRTINWILCMQRGIYPPWPFPSRNEWYVCR